MCAMDWAIAVLKSRWESLRAQLHGVVITEDIGDIDSETKSLIDSIENAAPNFFASKSNLVLANCRSQILARQRNLSKEIDEFNGF